MLTRRNRPRHANTARAKRPLNPPLSTGMTPHQCQCDGACKNRAVAGQAFCRAHARKCPNPSHLSGSEPDYEPNLWNLNKALRETHNCFSYAMNLLDKAQLRKCKKRNCDVHLPQPGAYSGHRPFSDGRPKTCPNMVARILGDNRGMKISNFTDKCPAGASKIALILDESDDYHYLRQDSNGYWSHKPGSTSIKNVDAYGHMIWNPQLANYNYKATGKSSLNYDIFCLFMCVPRNVKLHMSVDP